MLTVLQMYYVGISGALFLYAVYTPRNAVRAFAPALALNVFPLAALPYMSMDIARLGGMPLVYLPMTAIGLAMIVRNGLRLPRRFLLLYLFVALYLVYTFSNTVLARGISASNLMYWLAWPLNFLIFIAAASIVARLEPGATDRMLHRCVQVLVAASIVGLARYAVGIETDANFIPLMNRNGTVVLIALLFPLVFHVHATQGKSRTWLLVCAGTIALCVTLTFSRSGLLGLLAGTVLYYWRFSLMGLLKFCTAVLVIALFLASGIAERTTERLLMSARTVSAMAEGREVDRSIGDHNRVILVNSAIATAKKHFWFGTGLGMENYREGLRKASLLPVTSKAHNFYLSYFTELGLIGFALLLAILQRVYAGLAPMGSPFRAFRTSFLVMALMMTMNEYILLPELWLFFGVLSGISQRLMSSVTSHTARSMPARRPAYATQAVPAGRSIRSMLATGRMWSATAGHTAPLSTAASGGRHG